jgi:hypothetical protein
MVGTMCENGVFNWDSFLGSTIFVFSVFRKKVSHSYFPLNFQTFISQLAISFLKIQFLDQSDNKVDTRSTSSSYQ